MNSIFKNYSILYIIKSFNLGGAEKFTLDLCKHFNPYFKRTAILTSGGIWENKLTELGVDLIKYKIPNKLNLVSLIKLGIYLRSLASKFDIIHCQHRIFLPFLQFGRNKHRLIYTSHNHFDDYFQKIIYPTLAVGVCQTITKNIKDTTFIKKSSILNINNGVDVSEKKYINFKNNINIGFAGRLIDKKGIFVLAEAFNKLSKKHFNIRLIYKGDGPLKNKLKDYINQNSLDNLCSIQINDPQDSCIYQDIDILVLPTLYNEGLPLSVLEAMANGIIVISTNIGGLIDVVKDGETAFLIEGNDVNQLIEKLNFVLNNFSSLNSIRLNAQNLILKEFSLKKMIYEYEKIYLRLLNKSFIYQ